MKYVICYMASTSIDVYANSEDEAIDIFNHMPESDLMEELSPVSIEIREIFEEED